MISPDQSLASPPPPQPQHAPARAELPVVSVCEAIVVSLLLVVVLLVVLVVVVVVVVLRSPLFTLFALCCIDTGARQGWQEGGQEGQKGPDDYYRY